ncbi:MULTISPECIES: hypothetical protein [Calothrix]|uniref:Transmembrane protein n=2 Tax=Calothrix TaxID=1186 RepID=A0ABR8A4M8_9CYAN|nr:MULTISPECIES: hypothetical protein [Calothrix]MBD2194912.1 hypothetical protein [Calothrix parietina FACHB-288]MBD2223510.1 hypothetical protein [Calothrix anomala FACHB-343]
MEKSQTVQHEPTQPTGVTPELTNSKSRTIRSSQFLIHLLTRHPWLLLIGLSAIFVASAVLALYNLGSVGNVQQPEEIEKNLDVATVAEAVNNTPSENNNPTPLWMVAAIALSCASGCFIILRVLNRPANGKTIHKTARRYPIRTVPSKPPTVEPSPAKNPPVFVPSSSLTPLVSMQSQTKPRMTVLPPEQSYRPEKSKESLADLMDIRKQSSLSAILRN